MILRARGFDVVDARGARMSFPVWSVAGPLSDTMQSGRPNPGPTGQSLYVIGVDNFVEYFDSGNKHFLGFHLDIQLESPSGHPTLVPFASPFYRFVSNADGLQCELAFNAGGVLEVRGPTGLPIFVSSAIYMTDTWYRIQFQAGFGSNLGWKLKVEGTLIHADTADISSSEINQWGLFRRSIQPPGNRYDNYVTFDDSSSDGFNDIDALGAVCITTLFPLSDTGISWNPVPGPGRSAMVRDLPGIDANGSPDGDASYLIPTISGANVRFTMSTTFGTRTSPCFGRILAVAMSACAKPLVSGEFLKLTTRPRVSTFTLGTVAVNFVGATYSGDPNFVDYATYQAILTSSPETGQAWSDAELAGADWGIQLADDPGTTQPGQRVTQLYLEKVVSLEARSYDCGGGSYAF